MKVFQIYFNEDQLPKLDYTPYYNSDCTPFFENSVIRKLIEDKEHVGTDYFGVVSHKLREKIYITKTNWRGVDNICNTSDQQFTPELFSSELNRLSPDVMSFQRHIGHDSVSFADQFHPNFSKYFKEIMSSIGYDWTPTLFKDIIYCNYFVAKPEIYERYVKEMLAPAMDIMMEMPELFNNSHYPHPLSSELQKKFNCTWYPYHSFLCERMMSYYIHIHKLNCIHF